MAETIQQRAAAVSRNRDTVLGSLLTTAPGRKFLWNELIYCHLFAQTVDTSVEGHAKMCFIEGQRSHGLRLYADLQRLSPSNCHIMTVENAAVKLEEESDD